MVIYIFSLQFFNPNKYYTLEVLKGSDIISPLNSYREGYLLGYGVNPSNIILIFVVFFFVKDIFYNKPINSKKILISCSLVLFPLLFYALFGFISATTHSPYSFASYVWTLQYLQLPIIACCLAYLLLKYERNIIFIYLSFAASIIFQFAVSIVQFMKQSSGSFFFEYTKDLTFQTYELDQNNAIYRVSGTYLFHNQLALMVLTLIVFLTPSMVIKKDKLALGIIVLGFIVITLTQSRTIWLCTVIYLLRIIIFYRGDIILLFKRITLSSTKIFSLIIVFLSLLIIIILPRFILSLNIAYEGAGLPTRIKMASEALVAIGSNPILGYGAGTNEYVLHSFFPNGVMSYFPSAVHMALLQFTLEFGLLGLVSFCSPFLFLLRSNFSKKDSKYNVNSFVFSTSILIFFIYYLFQPHVGIVEFPYLGISLGYGIKGIYDNNKNHKAIFKTDKE